MEGSQAILGSLRGVAPETEDAHATPFSLGLDEARAQHAAVIREVAEAEHLHDEAVRNERAAADKLPRYSQDAA